MADVRSRTRATTSAAVLLAALSWTATACADRQPPEAAPAPATAWREPASYDYTLQSHEDVLWGTFQVSVRDGKVTKAVGLDTDSRRALREGPGDRIPTIGGLLARLDRARTDGADTAQADYAPDGRPERITLDPDTNAIDDEAEYVISAYAPRPAQP
ncbi:DUF6174 domain-containing protein [Streptomyces griseosporeus]|uniref:DUF6174 domain-containing protein n=1 Tax=Streptomyces griseosporeus TaxID=1910 RepID=UPI00167D2D64|nr:DUF6174 domain-containing protein [Streptomyces griseosporeus]GHF52846.1 hypothetical protein GCM10018783_22090 [Streptomyces griseosporeus]